MSSAYHPHGAALLDCFRGNRDATLVCHQDGERDDVPAAFWLRDSFDALEELALELCRGHVLDVGAGAGVHALDLQRRGLRVTAIDVVPECVEVMQARGVRTFACVDLFAVDGGPFDTILCLCNGLDKVETLAALPRFLAQARSLVAKGGQLLADSFDLRVGASPESLARIAQKQAAGRYFGEIDLRFEYEGRTGPVFRVLHVDYETFARVAQETGRRSERVQARGGHWLARAIAS